MVGPQDKQGDSPSISPVSELKRNADCPETHQPFVFSATFPTVMSGVRINSSGGKKMM